MMIDGGTLFAIVFVGSTLLTAFFLVYWHILHFILCKKYDALLFKEPIFNPMELAIYSSWPLSLVRSMAYVLLIAAPDFFITKRRFKELAIDRSSMFLLTFFSKIFLLIVLLDILFVMFIILWSIETYLFYD